MKEKTNRNLSQFNSSSAAAKRGIKAQESGSFVNSTKAAGEVLTDSKPQTDGTPLMLGTGKEPKNEEAQKQPEE